MIVQEMVSRDKVRDLRLTHPEWTQQKIADAVGITKQRVGQLLKKENLPVRHVRSSRPQRKREQNVRPCQVCGLSVIGPPVHEECRQEYYYVTVRCRVCDAEKQVLRSTYERGRKHGQVNYYCGRPHYFLGKVAGFS